MKLCAFCVVWFRALFVLIASQYWNTVGQYEGNRILYWFVDGVIAFTQPPALPSTSGYISGPAPPCFFLTFLSLRSLIPGSAIVFGSLRRHEIALTFRMLLIPTTYCLESLQ